MIELEVYAAGVRNLEKILELDHEFEAVPGLRYKVDSNHDIVYLDFDEPTLTIQEIRAHFSQARARAADRRRGAAGAESEEQDAAAARLPESRRRRAAAGGPRCGQARRCDLAFAAPHGYLPRAHRRFRLFRYLGELALLACETCVSIVVAPIRWRLFLRQIVEIGFRSQLVVIVTGGFHRRGAHGADVLPVHHARA